MPITTTPIITRRHESEAKLKFISLAARFIAILFAASTNAADRVIIGNVSRTMEQLPNYAATDKGFFTQEGLQGDVVLIGSTDTLIQALIAGQVNVAIVDPSAAINAVERGASSKIIGGTVPIAAYTLVISRFGTSIDTAARMAIHHYGLEPVKDVSLVQAGAVSTNPAAKRGDRIQAAILSYPSIIQARREGYRELLDIASLGVPYASTEITVRRSFMAQRRDAVTNYRKSILEATACIKKDKAFTIDMMMKCFRTKDKEMMDETYEFP